MIKEEENESLTQLSPNETEELLRLRKELGLKSPESKVGDEELRKRAATSKSSESKARDEELDELRRLAQSKSSESKARDEELERLRKRVEKSKSSESKARDEELDELRRLAQSRSSESKARDEELERLRKRVEEKSKSSESKARDEELDRLRKRVEEKSKSSESKARDEELERLRKRVEKSKSSESKALDEELEELRRLAQSKSSESKARDEELERLRKRMEKSKSSESKARDEELEKLRRLDATSKSSESKARDEELKELRRLDAKSKSSESKARDEELEKLRRLVAKSKSSESKARDEELNELRRLAEMPKSPESKARDKELLELKEKLAKPSHTEIDPEIAKLRAKYEKKKTDEKSSSIIRYEEEIKDIERKIAATSKVIASTDTASLIRDIHNKSQILEKKQNGVDVLFLMDWTGSMSSWISIAKQKVFEIVQELKHANGSHTNVRLGFIGYRDHCDGATCISFQDFNEDPSLLTSFLSLVSASGGGDAPEDIAGALATAITANWESASRIILHFGDAPCHGRQYHDCADDYPDGDPNGHVPEKLLMKLCDMGVDYTFARLNSTTDKMTNIFQNVYKNGGQKFEVLEIGSNTDKFLPSVVASVSKTITRTRTRIK